MNAVLLFISSPSTSTWYLGPFPLRAYAICIITGIVVATVIARQRWRARGGSIDSLEAVLVVAIPCGIVGARAYHVVTDYELYFGPGRHALDALKIWNGGLGIWGAVAGGAGGAYLVARRRGIAFAPLLDALAPALLVAQAIGRLGNWFNQELFGRPTTLAWGLKIAPEYRPPGYAQFATFHPAFLYELLWNGIVALVLVLVDRRYRLGHGKVFALYVAMYCAGRFWIEALRIDAVNRIGGFRLNNYTALIAFVIAVAALVWLVRNRRGRDDVVDGAGRRTDTTSDSRAGAGPTGGASIDDLQAGRGSSRPRRPGERL